MFMKMEIKKAVVKWYDARLYSNMHKLDEALARKMDIFDSIGFLINKDKIIVRIAHEITDSGEYRDIPLIPSGSVISIKELVAKSNMEV